VLQLLGRNTIK